MKEKKICQYCKTKFNNAENKKTAEHIIPRGLIELFPEQYVSFNGNKKYIDNKGMTISDVCKKCNGRLLSPLDGYGKQLIQSQFLEKIPAEQKDNLFHKNFEYHKLSRWLLKIIYNYLRSEKKDVTWFENALGYILYDIRVENISFAIFTGIHVNTTPTPEDFYNYLPLQINEMPKLYGSSLATISYGFDPNINSILIDGAFNTFCIRLGTAVFYIILWENSTGSLIKREYYKLLSREFPLTRLTSNQKDYDLKRVSVHTNTVMGYSHLVSNSGIHQDDLIVQGLIHNMTIAEAQDYFAKSRSPFEVEKTRTLVEMQEFPNNTKVQKKYKKFFGES